MLCVVLFGMPIWRPISAIDSRGDDAEKRFMIRIAFETLLIMASSRLRAGEVELAREMAGRDLARRDFGKRRRVVAQIGCA